MLRKYPKFVLFLVSFCLAGAGVWYFSNIWKEDNTQSQAAPNLKLLTSHSHPQAGDKWVVSFETIGKADLTITPTGLDTIGDLDFISLTCDGKEKKEEGALQILDGDVISFSDWQCMGQGELTHLVNIARKHTLKFQFEDKMAFAYNNPDSITDTFSDTSKIATSSNITVTGGQVKLSTCGNYGAACSGVGECCSGYCADSVCCDSVCETGGKDCETCGQYSSAGNGHCGSVNNSGQDPDNDCPGSNGACAATTCSGSGYSCGYLSGQQGCATCTYCTGASYSCTNYSNTTDCGLCVKCNGSGLCNNYYTAGTIDSTTPGTCNATHYRCSGSGTCTAPCAALAWTCSIDTWAITSCYSWCISQGYCDCLYASISDPMCSTNDTDCGMNFVYCHCKNYAY